MQIFLNKSILYYQEFIRTVFIILPFLFSRKFKWFLDTCFENMKYGMLILNSNGTRQTHLQEFEISLFHVTCVCIPFSLLYMDSFV